MKKPKDDLGARMKRQYEDRYRIMLPRRTYTIIRVDGRAFSTFTRQNKNSKPFDPRIYHSMVMAACKVGKELHGASFGYVQSDEASFLLTDFGSTRTCAMFDGNLQKLVSQAASMMTYHFNAAYRRGGPAWVKGEAYFDARVFVIPDPVEVANYFVWRQKDAVRNSVLGQAQKYLHKGGIKGMSTRTLMAWLNDQPITNIRWRTQPQAFKWGTVVENEIIKPPRPNLCLENPCAGRGWEEIETPLFTRMPFFLYRRIPLQWGGNPWPDCPVADELPDKEEA